MKRIVCYYRVSTREQGIDGLGIDAQKAAVRTYKRSVDAETVASFEEVESGRNAARPQLAAAIAACKKHKAVLVVAKLDRLSRNVAFTAALMDSGIEFLACDNATANKLTIHVLAAVAQAEAEAISQRTKEALARLKARGVKLGNPNGAAAIGAAIAGTQRLAAAYAAKVKPQAMRLRGRGYTLQQVADTLTAQGMLTRKGSRWTPTAVSRLLAC